MEHHILAVRVGKIATAIICGCACLGHFAAAQELAPDLILHHGKIVSVDDRFSLYEAIAVTDGRIQRLGTAAALLALKGPRTIVVDLAAKMVIPGLIDSHSHPLAASLAEFDHVIPQMDSVQDVLDYFAAR